MRNRRLKLLLPVCGVLLCAVVYWAASPCEPRSHGRRISAWLANYPRLNQVDWRESEAAIRAVGTNGIPYIFQELRRRDSFAKSMRAKLWFNGPIWVKRLVGPPVWAQCESCASGAQPSPGSNSITARPLSGLRHYEFNRSNQSRGHEQAGTGIGYRAG
jgi:hypothetical protein